MTRHAFGRMIVACLLTGCAASQTRAAVLQTPLDTLLPGGAYADGILFPGSMRFSEFAFRSTEPYGISAADVTVRIDNEGPFFDRVNVQFTFGTDTAATQAGDVFIDYRVDDESWSPLNRVGVRFTGPVPSQGVGAGLALLRQTVSTVDGSDLTIGVPVSDTATLALSNDGPGRLDDVNSQFLSLNPTHALRLSTEINLRAREDGRFDAVFSDQFSTIPEPAAVAIALPAGLALLGRPRRVPPLQPAPVA
jgi:hypothetical protein